MAKQLAFYFDASACTGCQACAVACKDKNDLPVGVNWRRVYQYGGGGWAPNPSQPNLFSPANVFVYSTSVACMHCQDALCAQVCPAKAIDRQPNGALTIDASKCIGCRYCEWTCPYDAPQYDERKGVMTKCNFCADLLAKGENPACVDACVMRALEYGELDELRSKYGANTAFEPLPRTDITQPAFVMTPHPKAQPAGKGTGKILGLYEES
jgi:anaerobic dimethyl sulfoxide reductase subunit B